MEKIRGNIISLTFPKGQQPGSYEFSFRATETLTEEQKSYLFTAWSTQRECELSLKQIPMIFKQGQLLFVQDEKGIWHCGWLLSQTGSKIYLASSLGAHQSERVFDALKVLAITTENPM